MEMEQLLSMGFPTELAAQALAATGGKSTVKATEWILSQTSHPHPNNSPNGSSFQQPKLDRFFHFPSSKPKQEPSSPSNSPTQTTTAPLPPPHQLLSTPTSPPSKRPKVFAPSSTSNPHYHTISNDEPLSERMRPRTIDDVIGQDLLLSQNSLLRSAIRCSRIPSIILWGPPGTGKTSIARAIVTSANSQGSSSYRFVSLSAVTCGVKDVRDAVEDARKFKLKNSKRTVLFLDEVHRFNKSQQDSFLPVIEDGTIVFIGATTENPSFHLVTPLLSRCRVLTLSPLNPHHVQTILMRAVKDPDKGLSKSLGSLGVDVSEDAVEFLSTNCDGDARVALNALEISAATAAARVGGDGDLRLASVSLDDAKEALQSKHLAYDRAGEEHYNLISALHKSMRGSDANASIYWLVRMMEGGEQPLYIARRLVRFAMARTISTRLIIPPQTRAFYHLHSRATSSLIGQPVMQIMDKKLFDHHRRFWNPAANEHQELVLFSVVGVCLVVFATKPCCCFVNIPTPCYFWNRSTWLRRARENPMYLMILNCEKNRILLRVKSGVIRLCFSVCFNGGSMAYVSNLDFQKQRRGSKSATMHIALDNSFKL